MAGSSDAIRCKVSFEKEALSIRHYVLPVDDPDNDADFYDRLVGKVDQDIVKAQSKAVTQPCFTLYWTDQDGDAICVDSEESLQVALSYVKPDAAGFSVLRLIAKFSQNGTVKISNGLSGPRSPNKLTLVLNKNSASYTPLKKPNGYVKLVKKPKTVHVQSPETSPQKPVNRAGHSRVAVQVMETAMEESAGEQEEEETESPGKTPVPVLCPGCDEQWKSFTNFKKKHWAECAEIENKDEVACRCCYCREICNGKVWNRHQRYCRPGVSWTPKSRLDRRPAAPVSPLPVMCPGCDEECANFNDFKNNHWAACSEIDSSKEVIARCCSCSNTFSAFGWGTHQRYCRPGAKKIKGTGSTVPVMCPGCDEEFANFTVFRETHWANCTAIEDRDGVKCRCPGCRQVFKGKSWVNHQRSCKSVQKASPQKKVSKKKKKKGKSTVPVMCPGCDQKCASFTDFKKAHWVECAEIDCSDEVTVRCCKCRQIFNGTRWCRHQVFCKEGKNRSKKAVDGKKAVAKKKYDGPMGMLGQMYSGRAKKESVGERTCQPGCGHVYSSAHSMRRHQKTCKLVPKTTGDGLDAQSERSDGSISPEKLPESTTWRSWARSNPSPEIPVSASHSSTGKRSVSPASTEEVDGNFDHREGSASPSPETGQDMEVDSVEEEPSQMDEEPEDVKPDLSTLNSDWAASQYIAAVTPSHSMYDSFAKEL